MSCLEQAESWLKGAVDWEKDEGGKYGNDAIVISGELDRLRAEVARLGRENVELRVKPRPSSGLGSRDDLLDKIHAYAEEWKTGNSPAHSPAKTALYIALDNYDFRGQLASQPTETGEVAVVRSRAAASVEDQLEPGSDFRERALALCRPPFRFEHGYVFDDASEMVADNHASEGGILRVRGWGRLRYMLDSERLQDALGGLLAEALTRFWSEQSKRAEPDRLPIIAAELDHLRSEAASLRESSIEYRTQRDAWEKRSLAFERMRSEQEQRAERAEAEVVRLAREREGDPKRAPAETVTRSMVVEGWRNSPANIADDIEKCSRGYFDGHPGQVLYSLTITVTKESDVKTGEPGPGSPAGGSS